MYCGRAERTCVYRGAAQMFRVRFFPAFRESPVIGYRKDSDDYLLLHLSAFISEGTYPIGRLSIDFHVKVIL